MDSSRPVVPTSRENPVSIVEVSEGGASCREDVVVVEEPMEIRLVYGPRDHRKMRSVSITMRTPGNDEELAAGFLFAENILQSPDQIEQIQIRGVDSRGTETGNIVRVELCPDIPIDIGQLQRHFFTTSSCGVCGKASLEALEIQGLGPIDSDCFQIESSHVRKLPDLLRRQQATFNRTGGLHAAGLADAGGILIDTREDVGRHNAVDKLVGRRFLAVRHPPASIRYDSQRACQFRNHAKSPGGRNAHDYRRGRALQSGCGNGQSIQHHPGRIHLTRTFQPVLRCAPNPRHLRYSRNPSPMKKFSANREQIFELLEHEGVVSGESVRRVHEATGVPEADIWGTAMFYTLLNKPGKKIRVCDGLTCNMLGADELAHQLESEGKRCERISCLGQCDLAPSTLDEDMELVTYGGRTTGLTPDNPGLPINLAGAPDLTWPALRKAREMGAEAVIEELKAAGLQGRGGAGFPAHFKWNSVLNQVDPQRYVVCNADEAEPGTFKDREVILRKCHLMLEGLAIAASVVGAEEIFVYIRGEYVNEVRALERAIAAVPVRAGRLGGARCARPWSLHLR